MVICAHPPLRVQYPLKPKFVLCEKSSVITFLIRSWHCRSPAWKGWNFIIIIKMLAASNSFNFVYTWLFGKRRTNALATSTGSFSNRVGLVLFHWIEEGLYVGQSALSMAWAHCMQGWQDPFFEVGFPFCRHLEGFLQACIFVLCHVLSVSFTHGIASRHRRCTAAWHLI